MAMHSVSSEPKRFRRRSLRTYPRGMGIMVVFCSFLALSLGPGLLNAYGVYEEEYNRLYDNKDEQEWQGPLGSPVIFIGIIQIFLANGMGFIGGKCAQRFGPGPAVFVGGLLMAAGLFAASYSQKVWQLCLSQGVVFGLGVCLTWIPAASAPSSWFSKDRGVATGVTHMGLGIGGLVFAPITRFLLEKAGTAGSLRWLALIMLVGVSIVSIGIHSKHHEQQVNEIIVSSARWSKCLEEAFEKEYGAEIPETSHAKSTEETSDCLLFKSTDTQRNMQSGKEQESEILEQAKPKHVRFVQELVRQETLDKLEGVAQDSQRRPLPDRYEKPIERRRRRQQQLDSMGVPAKPASRAATHKPTIFKSLRFWLLSLGIGMGQASWYTILLFMTSISVSVGLDVHNAAIVLGAINGASAVGQFAAGYAADLIGPINALVLFTFVATLSNLILFLPGLSFHVLLAYACVCGASIGAADPLTVIAGVMQFGRERAAMTTGLVYGSVGMLVTVMAPCAQVMQHELNRGFRPIYIFVLALFATSTLLLVLLRLRISRKLAFRA
ncbi:hypothetical protein LPJ78_004704 [Coemansia sp. RSA 989]|nr:hypothetical protein LPJ68_004372 [Coemansia sp. RSA 1086]KAJ1748342.1 hypothetical protein LPJ79_004603 [Coemansia sp. RSA 1821]KAJ1862453.1 hypothetical protein LPJ78_004704 [Coemansia sp. RSA 989]KAJ2669741.1 hypothetical protein IWW42_004423 [Coemansia sp. RSA 1085]